MYAISETVSQRGNTQIICNNYKFSFNRVLLSGETRWRCIQKNCKAVLLTIGQGTGRTASSGNVDHNHENISDRVLQRQHISAAAKRKATNDLCERPSKILCSILPNNDKNLQISDLKCVKENMYNARRKSMPTLPRSVEEVHRALNDLQPITHRGEDFLLENDSNSNIVILTTKTNLQCLCLAEKLYMDGTFNYCTKFFTQLFTVHGYLKGHYIPLAFCLLKTKSECTYKKCLERLVYHAAKNDLQLMPKYIVTDFEKAIQKAVKDVWPETQIVGCRFHLTQAWWRKIQHLGLTAEYKDKTSEIGQWLGYCFGLLFLEPEKVSDAFVFELSTIQPQSEKVQKFADYLVDNYISEDAHFPPQLWAENSASLTRTTNACESFHSHFNNSFYQPHPSLFLFIDTLLKFQMEVYIKINSINTPYKFQNSRSKRNQIYLEKHISDYQAGKTGILQFIKLASHYYSQM